MNDILKEILSTRTMHVHTLLAEMTAEQRVALYHKAKVRRRRIRQTLTGALSKPRSEFAVIAEFKRASPSRGDICPEADPATQAVIYERGGAAAMSVLTEPDYFKGSFEDLEAAGRATTLPLLCKDFIVDPLQIDLAKLSGADAVLLIAAALGDEKLRALYDHALDLGLDVLVEAHSQIEVLRALRLERAVIGINNRDLKTFRTNLDTTPRLMALIPKNRLVVSESGIQTREDLMQLRRAGAGGFLIGETLMRSGNGQADAETIRRLVGGLAAPRIKICGLRRLEDIDMVNRLMPDYVGFVFAKSRRQVDVKLAKALISRLNPAIASVGVFVNATPEEVAYAAKVCGLDVVQLHGQEDPQKYQGRGPVWKTFAVRSSKGLEVEVPYGNTPISEIQPALVSGCLFDTYCPDQAGGTGRRFLWDRALPEMRQLRIAAGGINADNLEQCLSILAPDVVDVSSGVEFDGRKDFELMKTFVEKARQRAESV